ncbi:MAG TPA: glycine--tRNA ligase subunit beta, partial [Alphaproteobacteria bacterium]|nr:glycine--tRNA ligase subunit beta [Alphaproteobacteria bacterium]
MKKMAELLLEILSEEIPARLQLRGVEDLKSLVCTKLKDQDLSFDSVLAHVGPRRLVLVVDGLPEYQRDRIEERKGPRSNAPKKAILGFLQSVGYGSLDHQNIEKRKIKGAEFYFLKRSVNGRATRDILPNLIRESIAELRWPKSMRWGSGNLRWVRPIHSILCLFDGHSVKGSLTIN